MNIPKVSIVVPVYNVEQYLDECVQSLLNQTLKDIEIILVDDESPDDCPQLCDKYAQADKRVRWYIRKMEDLDLPEIRDWKSQQENLSHFVIVMTM